MGFYGNTIYNTYGLQDKSVQPRHLDRNYWRWGRKIGVSSFQELRKKVLNLPKIDLNADHDTYFTEQDWKDCWAEAEKSMFAFHFSKSEKLRRVFGTSLILGWVLKETVVNNEAKQYGPSYTMEGETSAYQYVLYMLCLGNTKRDLQNKPGSLFKIALNLTDDEDEDKRMPAVPSEPSSPYKEEGVNWVNNDFLVGPIISSVHLLKNSVIEEKIKDLNVTEPKLANNSVITRTIKEDAVKPSKLDRDYWERTLLGTITTYTGLFAECAKVSTERNKDNITNNGTLYVCSSLQLPLPDYYIDPNDKDNCLKNSPGLYDIGRCLLWCYSNTIYVISASKGQIWKIDLASSLPPDSNAQKKYYTEEGKYYLPILNQTISPMIANSSILPNKLDRDYLEKIYISDIRGYDALFNEDNLKPISSTTTSAATANKSSSLYFLGNIFLENLPSQYTTSDNGYYISPNNQETASKDTYRYVLGRSLVWRQSNTTIYIISNTTGYTWKIDKVSRDASGSQIVDTGNVECKYSITLNTIPSSLIQNKSISTIKIADNAITRDKILDGEIITIKIADDAITSAKIAENQIEGGMEGHIKHNTITSYNIANDAITREKILDGEIVTIKIADDAITSAKIAEQQIEGGEYGHIKSDTITSYNIANDAVTTRIIKEHNIEGGEYGHIKQNTITSYNIAPQSITLEHFNIPAYNDVYINIPSDHSNIPILIDNSWRGGSKQFFNLGLNQIVGESMPLSGNSEFGSEKLETILQAIELRLPRNFGTIDSLSVLNEKALDIVNDPYIDHMTANLVISFRITGGELTNLLGGGGSCLGTIDFDSGRCVRFIHMATGKVCQMVIAGGGTPSLSIIKE